MKNFLKILFVLFLVSFASCKDEVENAGDEKFQVEVLGKGMDCGDLFLIRFEENDEERLNNYLQPNNAFYPVFYALGLPDELKQEGLFLEITIGDCETDDIPACTALGPGYGLVCVETAFPVSLVNRFP